MKMKMSTIKSIITIVCAIFCGIFTLCLIDGEIDITTIIGAVGFLAVSVCAIFSALEDARIEALSRSKKTTEE